jgi:hypothetical protein
MLKAPDRLSALAEIIESGRMPTRDELRRTAALQAIDIVQLGQRAAEEAALRDEQYIDQIRATVNP